MKALINLGREGTNTDLITDKELKLSLRKRSPML